MSRGDIEDFIAKQQKISDRNYQNFQETGIPRYYNAHDKAERLIDIARQALSAADDHQMCGTYRSELADYGHRAIRILHDGKVDDLDTVQLLKDIKTMTILRRLVSDPWEGVR